MAVFASRFTTGTRFRYAPLRPERAGTLAVHFGAQVEQSASIPPELARLLEGLGPRDRSSSESPFPPTSTICRSRFVALPVNVSVPVGWGSCPVAGSGVDDGCTTKRVAKLSLAFDSIESRVEFEAGPAANNLGPRAVLRRHAPSATR